MDKVGIKILANNEMSKCIKIVRQYCDFSIGEIKNAILNDKYVVEGKYVDEEEVLLIVNMYNELCKNDIKAELYEHDRKTTVEFLNNLVETYYDINAEIRDIIDQTNE